MVDGDGESRVKQSHPCFFGVPQMPLYFWLRFGNVLSRSGTFWKLILN